MSDDLIERLREGTDNCIAVVGGCDECELAQEAAERIAELEAELSAIRNRGGKIVRFGCPNCAGVDMPTPVMCCVRCGNRYYNDEEADE